MLFRRMLPSLALIAVAALPVLGQDKPVKLEWKFEKDKTFYQQMTTETKQSMKVMGSDVTQNQKQTFTYSWTPVEQTADKGWVLKQKIEAVNMAIDIGGNKIEFDSTKDTSSANPLADFFKALVGSEFKVTIAPDMKITKIDGRDDFIKKLANANQQMKPLLETILSEDSLKQMADPTFGAIPGKEVKKGDAWEKKTVLSMGPIGTYNVSYKYTYDGPSDKLEKVTIAETLTYTPPSDNPAQSGQLPFKIKKADLKSEKAGGSLLFDAAKGRVESQTLSLELKGMLDIEIGGMTTTVELTQTQSTTVKSSDVNPNAAAKPAGTTPTTPGK